jgi:hypothetical protein
VLAARPNGLEASVALPEGGDHDHVARVALRPAEVTTDALFAAIPERRTNRLPYATDRVVDAAILEELGAIAKHDDADLVWLTSADTREVFGRLTVDATAAIIGDAEMSRDDFAWYRQD